jgi:hypothetical protein
MSESARLQRRKEQLMGAEQKPTACNVEKPRVLFVTPKRAFLRPAVSSDETNSNIALPTGGQERSSQSNCENVFA